MYETHNVTRDRVTSREMAQRLRRRCNNDVADDDQKVQGVTCLCVDGDDGLGWSFFFPVCGVNREQYKARSDAGYKYPSSFVLYEI